MKLQKEVCWVVSIILVGLCIVAPFFGAQAQLDRHAQALLESGGASSLEIDQWGNPVKGSFVSGKMENVATATSAGPDGQFGTADDLTVSKTDLNKSGIVGRWIGTKTKEAGRGFFEGLWGKSKHP